jgi:hypothetical protein
MDSIGFERIERTPPHLKQPGVKCMQRNAAREEWVRVSRESLAQTKTMLSSFRAGLDVVPECHQCGAPATVRCTDCSPSGRYSCGEHSCLVMSRTVLSFTTWTKRMTAVGSSLLPYQCANGTMKIVFIVYVRFQGTCRLLFQLA